MDNPRPRYGILEFAQAPAPYRACTQEKNKGRLETRAIVSAPASGEELCFPLAQQAARVLRQCQGRDDELVALITSAPASRLDAPTWLRLNRDHWGIESGLHQRLDVSHNDDRCRVRNHNAMWVLAMMRRLSNSLFMALAPTQTTSRPCYHHRLPSPFIQGSPSPGYALGPGQMS